MVRAEKVVDIDETTNLVALTEDVQSSGETTVLQRNGKPVAKLVSVETKAKRRTRLTGKPMLFDDPLWKLIGTGDSGADATDVSANHHKYVADAIYEYKFGHRDD